MRRMLEGCAGLLSILLALSCGTTPAGPVAEAQRLFDRYVSLEQRYDPALVELYADSARVKKQRRLPDGQIQYGSMSGAELKAQIQRWTPGAVERRARNEYSAVRYQDLGNGYVRIEMRRRQLPKDLTSRQEFIVGPGPDGRWLIWEEMAEAPPLTSWRR
jgi:hypothetical protein